MPNFHFPWSDSIPEPEPEPDPEPTPAPPMPPAFGQPASPAQPLDTPPPPLDVLPASVYEPREPLPDDPPWRGDPRRCYVCGRMLWRSEETLCMRCETVGDVAFAVYCGELSEWPGQCVNDRTMMATHPDSLGLRKVPWQATVTAILSAAGVWLEDNPGE